MKIFSSISLMLLGITLPASADYVVDEDLGTLPEGSTTVSGTTALTVLDPGPPAITLGGNNNADLRDLLVSNVGANWGNEYVLQFTLAEPSTVTISKDVEFPEGDPDFFILDSLATEFDPEFEKDVATEFVWLNFLDDPPVVQDTVLLRAGTYYLVVESYVGLDGAVTEDDATFELDVNVIPALFPEEFLESLGSLGREGVSLTFDTFGSNFDTQLALFSFDGSLIAQNDNAGDSLQSQIVLPDGLDAGTYTVVVAGAGATFNEGPITTTGGDTGEVVFNYALASPNLESPERSTSTSTSPGSEAGETYWYDFTIFPGPPPVAEDLGKIADAGVPFEIHTLESLVDTEIAVFDEFGFLFYTNDDANAAVLQSLIEFPAGLTEGTWYAVVGGYNHSFADGFEAVPSGQTAGGTYSLTHPNGIVVEAVLEPTLQDWYRFQVGDPGVGADPGIQITSLTFNPETNEFTVAWDSPRPGPFSIQMGSEADLAAIDQQDNVLPVPAAIGVGASPVTVPVPAGLVGQPKVFLQVVEDANP